MKNPLVLQLCNFPHYLKNCGKQKFFSMFGIKKSRSKRNLVENLMENKLVLGYVTFLPK